MLQTNFLTLLLIQDGRFKDKEALIIKTMKFGPEFDIKVSDKEMNRGINMSS